MICLVGLMDFLRMQKLETDLLLIAIFLQESTIALLMMEVTEENNKLSLIQIIQLLIKPS